MTSTNESVQRQFGAVAANYAVSAVHASGPDLALLVETAALHGSEDVLDLGCGAGHTALALAPHAARVTAIDLTPEMLAVADDLARQRSVTNVGFRAADVAGLPFPATSFDLVTSRFSAHHYADPPAALAEAARVLRPGGRLLLADTVAPEDAALDTFLNTFELLRDASHVRDWRASEWRRMMEAAGFATRVVHRGAVVLDGADWVRRMRTPPSKVAILRELFAEAPASCRAAFELRESPWGLSLPIALIEARLA